jgi:broad specificity phosphatase PhoE
MTLPGEQETRVILVRHGETEWNRVERFRGRIDIDLNETGRRQADAVARRLSTWQIGAIYSSPLKRAWETAEPIASACGLEVTTLEGIEDVDYGSWAGLTPQEARTQYPEAFDTWVHTPLSTQFPQGESLRRVQVRAWSALQEVCSAHEGKAVAVVSHVVVNRALICAALGLVGDAFWKIGQDNAAINVLMALQGRYRVLLLNDICHLESIAPDRESMNGDAARR